MIQLLFVPSTKNDYHYPDNIIITMWYNNNYYHDYSYILKQCNLQIIVDFLRETLDGAISVRTSYIN